MSGIRNSKGELVAYDLPDDKRLTFEILLARHDERLDRIDSNINDLKYAHATNGSEIKKLTEKVTQSLNLFRETLTELHEVNKKNGELDLQCAAHEKALRQRENELSLLKKIGIGIVTILGLFFSGWQIFHKR